MEQRQLAWLITMRSQVRVLVPQPRKKDCRKVVLFSWFVGQDENRTAKPRFDNKELTQVLAPSKRRRYMREGAILSVPAPYIQEGLAPPIVFKNKFIILFPPPKVRLTPHMYIWYNGYRIS